MMRREWLRGVGALGVLAAIGWAIVARAPDAHAACAYLKAPGRFCRDVAEHCSPGCSPTSCAERVKLLTVQNSPTQYVTFFQGALNRCSQAGNRMQVFECAWGEVARTYPDLASDQCVKTGLFAALDTIAFNRALTPMPDPETCDGPTDGSVPASYFVLRAPKRFLEGGDAPPVAGSEFNVPPARNIGANEGRLNSTLRRVARVADPLQCSLVLAAEQFAIGRDLELAQAFADLSVTGRMAWLGRPASTATAGDPRPARAATNGFMRDAPGPAYCQGLPAMLAARAAAGTATTSDYVCPALVGNVKSADLVNGCTKALGRAYKVAAFLRGGGRGDLQWIAVSGEDDQPHRPVNVPRSAFPQYDVLVTVRAPAAQSAQPVAVRSRFTVAQFKPPRVRATITRPMTIAGDPVLAIGPSAEILLFVHGMDSRAEEADDIAKTLFRHLREKNSQRNLTVIAVDLPTSGYADNIDYDRVSPLSAIGAPDAADFRATGKTPLLDFIEDFIVGFVEELEKKSPGAKSKLKVVMGGSLGGNMSLRLGRRPEPWLPRFVVWSPASIWNSLAEGADITKHAGPRSAWKSAQAARDPSDPDHLLGNRSLRRGFFTGWDKPIVPIIIPMAQSDTWQSDHYPCKRSMVASARLDRHETYDPRFLAWHWRLGAEQLIYSHQTIDPATREPRFKANTKRMLLMCGVEDNITYNDICGATQRTAPRMTTTPGRAFFLEQTGHSLDNERRDFVADQIIAFLDESAPAGPLPVTTPLAPAPPQGKKTLGELCLAPSECESNRCSGFPLRCEAQPPTGKKNNGQPCVAPSECQSNRCVITCQAQPEKKPNGQSCVLPEECLSNRCSGFPLKCEAQPVKKADGQACLQPSECLSNRCSGFPLRCGDAQPPPASKKTNGEPCFLPSECLSNRCSGVPLKCEAQPAKKANGESCLQPSECLSNRCSGFPLRCEPQPPPPTKKANGQTCLMPSECLSNRCSGFPLRCEAQPPPPTKKANGQSCWSPSECQSNRCSGFPLRCAPQPWRGPSDSGGAGVCP